MSKRASMRPRRPLVVATIASAMKREWGREIGSGCAATPGLGSQGRGVQDLIGCADRCKRPVQAGFLNASWTLLGLLRGTRIRTDAAGLDRFACPRTSERHELDTTRSRVSQYCYADTS